MGNEEESIKDQLRREVWARFPAKEKYGKEVQAVLIGLLVAWLFLSILQ